jgi:hypothetical protein
MDELFRKCIEKAALEISEEFGMPLEEIKVRLAHFFV